MRRLTRHCQETGPLDVKVTWYQRSYQPRFSHRRSCASASAYQVEWGKSKTKQSARRRKREDREEKQREGGVFTNLLTTRVVHELDLDGLQADDGKAGFQLGEHAQRFCELLVDLWDARA